EARGTKPLPSEQLKAARVPRRFVSLLVSMLAIEPTARPAGARQLTAKLQAVRGQITSSRKVGLRFAFAATIVALAIILAVRALHLIPIKATSPAVSDKSVAV